jgi:hypothetical protein
MVAVLTVMNDMDLSHNLLGFGWLGWFRFSLSWSSWYAAGAKLMCMVLDLATGGDACELCWFGCRWHAYELCWFWLQVRCL